jgi:hypothetical protein
MALIANSDESSEAGLTSLDQQAGYSHAKLDIPRKNIP